MHFPKEVPSIVEKIEESGLFSRHEMLLKVKCCPQVAKFFCVNIAKAQRNITQQKENWRKRKNVSCNLIYDPPKSYNLYSHCLKSVCEKCVGELRRFFWRKLKHVISKSYCGDNFVKRNFHFLEDLLIRVRSRSEIMKKSRSLV